MKSGFVGGQPVFGRVRSKSGWGEKSATGWGEVSIHGEYLLLAKLIS